MSIPLFLTIILIYFLSRPASYTFCKSSWYLTFILNGRKLSQVRKLCFSFSWGILIVLMLTAGNVRWKILLLDLKQFWAQWNKVFRLNMYSEICVVLAILYLTIVIFQGRDPNNLFLLKLNFVSQKSSRMMIARSLCIPSIRCMKIHCIHFVFYDHNWL